MRSTKVLNRFSVVLILLVAFATSYFVTEFVSASGGEQSPPVDSSWKLSELSNAEELAGIELIKVTPDAQLSGTELTVTSYDGDNSKVMVQRAWVDPESKGAIMLFEENEEFATSGATDRKIAGIDGSFVSYPANDRVPERLIFSWLGKSGTVTVIGFIDGVVTPKSFESYISALDVN